MKHYICLGECKGHSIQKCSCSNKQCSKKDQPLIECNCQDSKHKTINQEFKDL
jgi:hypothetical protein